MTQCRECREITELHHSYCWSCGVPLKDPLHLPFADPVLDQDFDPESAQAKAAIAEQQEFLIRFIKGCEQFEILGEAARTIRPIASDLYAEVLDNATTNSRSVLDYSADFIRWQLETEQEREATADRRRKVRAINLELIELAGELQKVESSLLIEEFHCAHMQILCRLSEADARTLAEALKQAHDVAFKADDQEQWLELLEGIAKLAESKAAEAALLGGKMLILIDRRRNRDLIRRAERQERQDASSAERKLSNYYRWWYDEGGLKSFTAADAAITESFNASSLLRQTNCDIISLSKELMDGLAAKKRRLAEEDAQAIDALRVRADELKATEPKAEN